MSRIATIAALIAIAAAIIAISLVLVGDVSRRPRGATLLPKDLIKRDALSDQRSLLQAALATMETFLLIQTDTARDACQRLVRLLQAAPWLVASPVLSDIELAAIEDTEGWLRIWIASVNDFIEFEYPATGPSFSRVVLQNLRAGVQYRYMVPASERSIERARIFTGAHPNVEVRFPEQEFWDTFRSSVDEMVVYERKDQRTSAPEAYYLYPGSDPRMWIKADSNSARFRLQDLEDRWSITERGSRES